MRKLLLCLLLLIILMFAACKGETVSNSNPRFTIFQLCDNKVLIIDQLTGKIATYHFDTTTYSPDALYFLELDWTDKPEN